MSSYNLNDSLKNLQNEFGADKVETAIKAVEKFQVEVPSWIFGPFGGGRFGDYMPPGFARDIFEKLDDAALVNELTGASAQIATHTLWDFSEDGIDAIYDKAVEVKKAAESRGLKLGSINPTYFLKGSHTGSLSSYDDAVRERYIKQTILSGKIAEELSNKLLSLWLPDGSNYPGQLELTKLIDNTMDSLRAIAKKVSPSVRVLIEYKVFEPGTYSTVLADWGSSLLMAQAYGPNAGVLIDMGHHYHSTNIEQIVARLVTTKMHGGFHFNTRYAADDDHSVEPNPEMARIFNELVKADVVNGPNKWDLMIDQCSSRENRMHAIIHSIDSLQISLAKAMLVDQEKLLQYQADDAIILANRLFNNALILADVRPIVAMARKNKNLPLDPIETYVKSGYQEKIEKDRK
ncbi:MAG: L-rhamnose isomerase [Deferribacteres bacterium]|nr:L-rhamnose isomerase [Deferribacteres bacterium]